MAVAFVLVLSAPAQAAFPGSNGRVAFGWFELRENVSPPTNVWSIDVARPDGSGRRSLRECRRVEGQPDSGDCSIDYRSPAWSPDGGRLAFDAGDRLAVMRSDGTGFRLLDPHTSDDGEPAWSPGGRRLVFSGRQPGGMTDLYVLDLGSGDVRRLTFRGGRTPAWSWRGRIAFTRGGSVDRPGLGVLHTVRPDGTGLRRVIRRGSDPTWSPHGFRLAFVRRLAGGRTSLRTVRADGTDLRRVVTPGADSPDEPAWSPDGKRIAYMGFDGALLTQRLDGRGLREVAHGGSSADHSFGAFAPDWQPLP